MSLDWDLQEKIDIVSGAAEARIAERKLVIAAERDEARRHLQLSKRVRKEINVDASSPLLPTVQSLSRHEVKNYSLSRAISYLCKTASGARADDCLEAEISRSVADDLKVAPKGLFVPLQLRPRASGLDSNTNAAGKYLVTEQLRDLIDLLRAQTRLTSLGVTWISGLRQPATFALETTGSSASWMSENQGTDVTQTDLAFALMTLRPRTLLTTTCLTKQILTQSSLSLDQRIARDLTRAHAEAIEKAAINGSGSNSQPVGLLSVPGVNTVSIGSSGGVPTYDIVCQLEQAVADKNADFGSNGFLSTPAVRKKLRVTYQNGTGSDAVWIGDTMLEKTALVSTAVPSTLTKGSGTNLHALAYGNWSEMIIGEWGVLDVLADPYARKEQGLIEVTSFSMIDIGIPRPQSFAVVADAALS